MRTKVSQAAMMSAVFLILLAALEARGLAAEDGSGLKVSASVDAVGSFYVDKQSRSNSDADSGTSDRFDVREAEFLLYGPIDHLFDGTLSLAAHQEDGVAVFEVHEAHIGSSRLVPRSRFKLGQFFLGIGRLNRMHRHEWPFISAPKVQRQFFGDEGVLDSGAEYTYLMPLPFYLDLSLGLTNGWVYGHAHDAGKKPRQPTHYARLGTYGGLFAGGGAQLGLNYLHRQAADGEKMTLVGSDMVAKWRRAGTLDFLLQSEIWHRTLQPQDSRTERALGAYLLPQVAMSPSVQLGLRLDYFTILSLQDVLGNFTPNANYAYVPTVTYKPSEFSSFRLAYIYAIDKQSMQADKLVQSVEVQTSFNLGAHPAHEF